MDGLTVGQVAERFGITVRTLHHYDEIGLLIPSRRAASGYRVYTSADLTRLSQVIVYRRLELPLDEIARLLDEGNAVSHLVRQRERVMARLDEMKDLVEAIDLALEKAMTNTPMTDDDMRELFGDGFDDYRVETEQKWARPRSGRNPNAAPSPTARTSGFGSRPRAKPLRRPCPTPSALGCRPTPRRL
ncbi:HTH-type transcriptional activator tipA [Mycobacterium ulcerans str. Harvey]|uniref:HTH-type transcriptional activator tipA n=1 Tax=Mycobacterium ulcerans str. Harvey TaxID=1299332 RepID=A0ABP3AT56_MYCUL|nr:HTH-type transcriptional activator tipA [Mycobacterium ulcerans str. Harvey]